MEFTVISSVRPRVCLDPPAGTKAMKRAASWPAARDLEGTMVEKCSFY